MNVLFASALLLSTTFGCDARPGLDTADAEIPPDGAVLDAAPPMACGDSYWMVEGWPMYLGCPERRSRSAAVGPATPDNIRYVGQTSGETETHTWGATRTSIGPAVDAEGNAYIGSGILYATKQNDVLEYSSQLFQAFNIEGTLLWRFETELSYIGDPGDYFGDEPPNGVPTLTSDAVYLFARHNGTFNVELISFSYEGDLNWISSYYGGARDLTVGPDGTLYFLESKTGNKRIVAMNPDGTERWSFKPDSLWISLPTLDAEGRVYFAGDGIVYSIDQDGNLLWNEKIAHHNRLALSLGDNGEIYFFGGDYVEEEFQNFLYAVSVNDGSLLWSHPVSSPGPSVAVGPGGMVVGGTEDGVMAFSPEGDLLWTYEQVGSDIGSPAIDGEGTIYISASGFHAIRRDGTLKWRISEGGLHGNSPAIGVNGTLYIGRGRGEVLCVIEP